MSAPRIGFDARYINDRYHGIGRYAFHLLEELVRQAPEFSFVIFRGREADTRFQWSGLAEQPNVELRQGPWPLYWPQEQLQWPRLLRAARVDLFHTPYFIAPLLASVPVFITVHDLIFDHYPTAMPMWWAWPYYRLLMGLSVQKARRVVTVSQSTAHDLANLYRLASEKLLVAPEGAEEGFKPLDDPAARQALRRRYELPQEFILAVGARRPHKNLGRLVHAFAAIHTTVPHSLVFAGVADRRFPDEARQAASQHRLNGQVRFLDWVPEADLPALYSLADVVAVPSLMEGFGLTALEAMACGTPVLAANNSSLPEVVGEAGMLVDPLDTPGMAHALEKMLLDPYLRGELRTAGLERVRRFRWEHTARQVLSAYRDLFTREPV